MNEFERDTPIELYVNDYGIDANTLVDTAAAISKAIEAAKKLNGPVKLKFIKGTYHFYRENAILSEYYVTNSTSEKENSDPIKHIGIHLKACEGITLDGMDSLFVFHGKMTPIVIDQSSDVEIRNLRIDFSHPTVSEMVIKKIGFGYVDFKINEDSKYNIKNGKLVWQGDENIPLRRTLQFHDPVDNITWRSWIHLKRIWPVKKIGDTIRWYGIPLLGMKKDLVCQLRDNIRDETGILIHKSKNIKLENLQIHFVHGLGIVAQLTENLDLQGLICKPRKETARTTAFSQDIIHLAGNKGKIKIQNCELTSSHDDAINIHGTYLKIIKIIDNKTVMLKYMHAQSYGIEAYFEGDQVDFIHNKSLKVIGSAKVYNVKRLTPRLMVVKMEEQLPNSLKRSMVIENTTWTPEVEIIGNFFSRIPTRGILVTTQKKVLIAENTFERTQMSAIKIADDARSWYESGRVADVTIRENHFIKCGEPVISIEPENSVKALVHENIIIEKNTFIVDKKQILKAKSSNGIIFAQNKIISETDKKMPLSARMHFSGCKNVYIKE